MQCLNLGVPHANIPLCDGGTGETEMQLLNVNDVCRKIKVSRTKFYEMLAAGEIPEPVIVGCRKKWTEEEIEAWVRANCPKADKFARTYRG